MKTIFLAAVTATLIAVPATTHAQESAECYTGEYQGAPIEICPEPERDPTNCYWGDYQGAPIEICMPTGWEPDPSWTYQGKPIVMHDSTVPTDAELQAQADAWMATHECWIDDDPSQPIPQGEFVTYDNRTEPGAIGSHSIGGTPCGYQVGMTDAGDTVAVATPPAPPAPPAPPVAPPAEVFWLDELQARLVEGGGW